MENICIAWENHIKKTINPANSFGKNRQLMTILTISSNRKYFHLHLK